MKRTLENEETTDTPRHRRPDGGGMRKGGNEMTRAIKFRGRTDTGKWVYGDSIKHTDNATDKGVEELIYIGNKVPNARKVGAMKWIPVEESTVGQYTGFRDIHGTEIYEGDEVKIRGAVSATVEWDGFGFHIYGLEDVNGRRPDMAFSEYNRIEVIGNIHDQRKED